MSFGDIVRKRRREPEIILNDLAARIGVSSADRSRIARSCEKLPAR